MSRLSLFEKTLGDLSTIFQNGRVLYMIIGGLANAIWGNPRATLDIDVTIWAVDDQVETIVSMLKKKFQILVESPLEFIAETRVLPIKNRDGLRVDIIFGVLPFEREAIDRAVEKKVGESMIKFCSAEDLILFKIISERRQDLDDVRGIIHVQQNELDFDYLEPRIQELADLLERTEIRTRWNTWKQAEGL